ncbi:sterol desaturase family protein [Ekhidna sp.]|uniref:sterol desaturase family protein n=1 Tax=Ekhidna sp. TaxID=2608089 RepID=UPI003519BA53
MKEAVIYPNQKAPSLFRSKILNALTWSHPALIFTMYLLLSAVAVFIYYSEFNARIDLIIIYFLSGLFSWTFAEYLLHRFIYHKIKDASYDTGFHYMFHGIHHAYPNDKSKTVLPPVPSLVIAGFFFCLFYVILGHEALIFSPGFVIGYSVYMWIHTMIHRLPVPSRFNFWWKHHNIHHYQQHDRAFGVSTPLWDIIFRTMPKEGRKTTVCKFDKNELKNRTTSNQY